MQSFLYVLLDPATSEPRYVGITRHPAKRLRTHLANARRGEVGHKANWLRSLSSPPVMQIQGVYADWQDACTAEVQAIERLRCTARLTNVANGGEGSTMWSPSMREALGEKLRGRKFTEDHKRKIGENVKAAQGWLLRRGTKNKGASSSFVGVYSERRKTQAARWRAQMNGRYLGLYDTEQAASQAVQTYLAGAL